MLQWNANIAYTRYIVHIDTWNNCINSDETQARFRHLGTSGSFGISPSMTPLMTRERCVRKTCTGAKYCKMKCGCIGVISRGIDSSGRPMMYTTGITGGCSPHVFYMHARVGRCMHATKEKWNNDVSFNASVAIFYLRITRDNGRPEYEYVPRPWYHVTHACTHTHTQMHTYTYIHTSIRGTRPLLYSLYKRAFV